MPRSSTDRLEALLREQRELLERFEHETQASGSFNGGMRRKAHKLTPWRVGRELLSLQTLCRLCSAETRNIARCILHVAFVRAPPVARARLSDIAVAVKRLHWSTALTAPTTFLSEVAGAILDAMGASFVKLAQIIAHSPMLAPEALVRACKASLARCSAPVVPFAEVVATICRELSLSSIDEIFETLEETPLASASIAQVHHASLRDGRQVVLKVVRPGVRERLEVDLEILWLGARAADVLLGPLLSELLSSSAAAMVDELRQPILAECDLTRERVNMLQYRSWLRSSAAVRRAGLRGAVWVPEPIPHACSSALLTMEFVDGHVLADMRTGHTEDVSGAANHEQHQWKLALARALAVQALSVLDGQGHEADGSASAACFHADLHMGNVLYCPARDCMAFVDFGVCGSLPPFLRGALLLQALSFVVGDMSHFAEGFAFALRTMPREAEGAPDDKVASRPERPQVPAVALDTIALAEDLTPLFAELAQVNPLRPDADGTIDPALYPLLVRGQLLLHEHGVQLPKEFALLIKTMLFGADYITMFRGREMRLLSSSLGAAAVAFVSSNGREVARVIPPAAYAQIVAAVLRSWWHATRSNLVTVRGLSAYVPIDASVLRSMQVRRWADHAAFKLKFGSLWIIYAAVVAFTSAVLMCKATSKRGQESFMDLNMTGSERAVPF